jgi:hypothetical protein
VSNVIDKLGFLRSIDQFRAMPKSIGHSRVAAEEILLLDLGVQRPHPKSAGCRMMRKVHFERA